MCRGRSYKRVLVPISANSLGCLGEMIAMLRTEQVRKLLVKNPRAICTFLQVEVEGKAKNDYVWSLYHMSDTMQSPPLTLFLVVPSAL